MTNRVLQECTLNCPACQDWLSVHPERAMTDRASAEGLREAIAWFIDHNPNATASDLRDGVRFLLDDPSTHVPTGFFDHG